MAIMSPSSARFFALRLKPEDDLLAALAAFVSDNGILAGWIAGAVGSLSHAALRYAHEVAAQGGTPARDAALLLADVLSRMEQAGRELAAEADRRGIAGRACEQFVDALHP